MDWPENGAASAAVGTAMHSLAEDLYAIPRSITGNGFRRTLERINEILPLSVREVPSGTRVLDWVVPDEWNVREAWIKDPAGELVVEFSNNPLHLVGYSVPVHGHFSLQELRPHLHTLPDQPTLVPYRTSYYERRWGFCLPHARYESLPEGDYEVLIDATLAPGSLTYGEAVLEGNSDDTVLLSAHTCHPGMVNDNLSGMTLAVAAGRALQGWPERRYTYRILFIPGTIGAITWLARNSEAVQHIRHGLVLSGVGGGGSLTYKRSRRGDAEIDRIVEHVLRESGAPFDVREFVPYGYDERQYCSPGFNLAVGCFMRTPWGEYPEYHTSADNLEFVTASSLADSFEKAMAIIQVLENNQKYWNTRPYGEPQLGRRGLYRGAGGAGIPDCEMALLWVLNLSDGAHSLLDVAERAQLPFSTIRCAADDLLRVGLLATEKS